MSVSKSIHLFSVIITKNRNFVKICTAMKKTIAGLMAFCILLACTQEESPEDAIAITSESSITLTCDGGSATVSFTANGSWTAALDREASWLSVSPASGSMDGSVTLTAQPNPDPDERSATVCFTCGTASASVTLTQKQKDAIVQTPSMTHFDAAGGSLSVELISNVDVQVSIADEWVRRVDTKSLKTEVIQFFVDANSSFSERETSITFSGGSVSETITIVQDAREQELDEAYIPDDAFRGLLLDRFDADGNGILTKAECEAVEIVILKAREDPSVADIVSIQGIEFFTRMIQFAIDPLGENTTTGKLSGTIDLSRNSNLLWVYLYDSPGVEKVDVSGCPEIRHLVLEGLSGLKEIVFCQGEKDWPLEILHTNGSLVGPELDLSCFPFLQMLSVKDCKNLERIWLRTGIELEEFLQDSVLEVLYKGDDIQYPVDIPDPVFRKYLVHEFDSNNNGVLSKLEAEKIIHLSIDKNVLDAIMEEGDTLKSFAGISSMKYLESFAMIQPQGWTVGDMDYSKRIRAEFIDEFALLSRLSVFQVDGNSNPMLYGHIPEEMTELPNLEWFELLYCPFITGTLPMGLLLNSQPYYVDVTGSGLSSMHISVPDSKLLEYPVRGFEKWFYAREQKIVHETYDEMGNPGFWLEDRYSTFTFRSDVDGTGPVHPDGEIVVYNKATAGKGADIIITGDGYTAENNTIGGTLEKHLYYSAEVLFSIEPFNKMKEHLNVYLVFAHSQTEGAESESTKFSAWYNDPKQTTSIDGDREYLLQYLGDLGFDLTSATVVVLMNAPYYGGTCHWLGSSAYEFYSVIYMPFSNQFESGLIHETVGHGFGHVSDEYSYGGTGYVDPVYWSYYGVSANVDSKSKGDPTKVLWAPYIKDSRYADEHLGAYEGGYTYAHGVWRPTYNSIMNTQWDAGGDRFNAPCREAIWLRAMFLSRDSDTVYPDWETYYKAQDREDFVTVDLAPAPASEASSRTKALLRKQSLRPSQRVLPCGLTLPEPPKHTPPQFNVLP